MVSTAVGGATPVPRLSPWRRWSTSAPSASWLLSSVIYAFYYVGSCIGFDAFYRWNVRMLGRRHRLHAVDSTGKHLLRLRGSGIIHHMQTGSVGYRLPGVEVVLDHVEGRDKPGEGEILIRGRLVM